MLLTEEHVHTPVPRSSVERQKFIAAKEKMWMSLEWDRNRFSHDLAQAASQLLSAIAFSDHADPIDLNLLSEDGASSGDAGSSQRDSQGSKASRGSKRRAETDASRAKPTKKSKRSNHNTILTPGTQVACLDKSANQFWVLGYVNRYLSDIKKYEVLDDADGEEQTYRVFKKHLRVIPKKSPTFEPKKKVLAVYPGTTVFYPARLVSRKGKNWMVEFDDEDESDEGPLKEIDGRLILQE